MISVGFHVTWIVRTSPAALKAVRVVESDCAAAAFICPGVAFKDPTVSVAGPDQYDTDDFAIVSFAPPAPVVKVLVDTVAVNEGNKTAFDAFTVTDPRWPEIDVVPGLAEPRFAEPGTLMESAAVRR